MQKPPARCAYAPIDDLANAVMAKVVDIRPLFANNTPLHQFIERRQQRFFWALAGMGKHGKAKTPADGRRQGCQGLCCAGKLG